VPENQHVHQLLSTDILLCEGFRLDRLGLSRLDPGGVASPVALGSRALDLAWLLADRHGELISKDEIMETVWPGRVVEENNLTVQISTLRRVFDQARAEGSCIQTVVGHGYRFVAPVTRVAAETLSTPGAAPSSGNGSAEPIVAENGQGHSAAVLPMLSSPAAVTTPGRPRLWAGIIAAGIAAVGLVALLIVAENWRWPWQANQAPRMSIVVLPFTNLSDDPKQQYFADGITEDLTTDLSRISHMLVISSGTVFTYRNKPFDLKQIGRELDVRYVLEGSVQRSGGKVRVNAQLINAETDAHLWAERFDRDMGDLFALQSEITRRIADTLSSELVRAEAARPTEHPDALDYIFRGRAVLHKGVTPDNHAQAVDLFEHALALDPQSVEAKTLLAATLSGRVLAGMTNSRAADISRAKELIEQALATFPGSELAHLAKGRLLRAERRCQEAIPEYEMVIASDPNSSEALFQLGVCKLYVGSIDETIPLEELAIHLNPRDPSIFNRYLMIGEVHLLQSRTEEAISWLERARTGGPQSPYPHAWLASAYALNGEAYRAAAELSEARRLAPDARYSSIARSRAVYFSPRKIRDLYEATYFAGLRKAGVPEE
jgi:TolB-like protein/DNA-binding winged helix-turn-helix (wHTH) protein/Flp pilus assembly protein TadD